MVREAEDLKEKILPLSEARQAAKAILNFFLSNPEAAAKTKAGGKAADVLAVQEDIVVTSNHQQKTIHHFYEIK